MSDTVSNSPNTLDITAACQLAVEDCLAHKIELTTISDNLKAIGITPKVARDNIKQITQWIGERVNIDKAWRVAERQCPRASVMMIKKSFISEIGLLMRLIGEMIWINNMWVKLQLGLYLPQNWHPSIYQESWTTLWNSLLPFSISPPLQLLPVPFWLKTAYYFIVCVLPIKTCDCSLYYLE